MVMSSQPASWRSRSACEISSRVSPMPRIRLDLVTSPNSRAWVMHVERAVVAERRADPLEDPRHGLDVVGQHLGTGLEDLAQQVGLAVEVGDEVLDAGVRVELVDLLDRLGVQPGAAVGQVVAGDAGDRGVAQLHLLHALGHPPGLVAVERLGLAGVDLAEVAAPGALVAADEERRLAVLPALEDVGAAGLLADRVQALGLHEVLQLAVLRAHLRPGLDPLRLALDRGLRVADLETEQLATVREPVAGAVEPSWWGVWVTRSLYAAGRGDPNPSGVAQGTSRRRKTSAETSSVTTSRTPR